MTIIIPYRNRSQHLNQFLAHYRRLLPDAYFLVVEQSWKGLFNRAKLFNIGVLECKSDYYVFHDVDMLVQGTPDYSRPDNPTHCATNASQFNWQMPFPEYFGGVVIMTHEQITAVDGWSNRFYGWGGEENEMHDHILRCGMQIDRRPHRYLSLPHPRAHPTGYIPERMAMAQEPRPAWDGLHETEYKLIETLEFKQGIKIIVEI